MSEHMNDHKKVRRNIRWDASLDQIAVQLAAENGFYPEKKEGGVSALLAFLVEEAAGNNDSRVQEDGSPKRQPTTQKKTSYRTKEKN